MSFSEFMDWLRNFFNRNTQPAPPPPSTPEQPSPEPETPVQPVDPTEPTKLVSLTTSTDKVTLSKDIEFKATTEPEGQYQDCKVDLSGTSSATLVSDIDLSTGVFTIRFDKASKSENEIQTIQVSHPEGNQEKSITVSQMKLFWHNHSGRENICDETLFANQCAIRMGAALELSGIKLSTDRRVLRRCTTEYRAFADHKHGLVKGHVLAAQELANWIKSQPSTFGSREVVHSKEEVLGRSGIIFFRDGWGTTDHIDVWDGENLVGGFPDYFASDFKELWFWDLY